MRLQATASSSSPQLGRQWLVSSTKRWKGRSQSKHYTGFFDPLQHSFQQRRLTLELALAGGV